MSGGVVVTLESTHGYQQLIRAGNHVLVADEPAARGGEDAGPTPTALAMAGLAACTAITLQMYAERKGWTLGRVHVRIEVTSDGDRMQVARNIVVEGALTPEQVARLGEIAERTPVTRLIRDGAPIATVIQGGSVDAATVR